MNIRLNKIMVATKDRVKSFNFFSFVFDADIETDSEGVEYLVLDSVRLYFDESMKVSTKYYSFIFSLTTAQDFIYFKQKLKLAYYKDAMKSKITKESETFVEFKDPSGNLWRTEVQIPRIKANYPAEASNVRNF